VHYLAAVDVPRLNMFYAARQLARFLARSEPFDAVLLYNLEWLYLSPILRFVERRKVPLIIEYEDDALEPIESARLQRWYRARGRKAVAAARRAAAGVVAVSEELAGQLGLPNSIVVPGAVGDDLLALADSRTFTDSFRLVYAGSLTRSKGVHELISAVEALSGVTLDIAGNGPELASLRSRASDRITIRGEVSREELVSVYAGAHAAVNPHIMLDAMVGGIFPFKVAESIAAGLPVISTRLGSKPDALSAAIVEAASSAPEALAAAIGEARARYASLTVATVRARRWIEQEYSAAALARKLDHVLREARRIVS
jgi:glycosyltransferase involved in cell wall biosynthesis